MAQAHSCNAEWSFRIEEVPPYLPMGSTEERRLPRGFELAYSS